jgi:glycosyltransferase involved in cell wall biosynthesis
MLSPTLNKIPLVSIGVPIYNGERTIRKALESILEQKYKNIEIIISDNASVDDTYKICNNYTRIDKRIRLFRQNFTISPFLNFKFVLEESIGEYFMWASDDDYHSSDFISDCLNKLLSTPNCIAVTSIEKLGENKPRSDEITGSKVIRIQSYLQNSFTAYGFFYSLTKTSVAKSFRFPDKPTLAIDWMYVCHLLNYGEIRRSFIAKSFYGNKGISHSNNRYSEFRNSLKDWFFPLSNTIKYILKLTDDISRNERDEVFRRLTQTSYKIALGQSKFEATLAKSKIQKYCYLLLHYLLLKNKCLYTKILTINGR